MIKQGPKSVKPAPAAAGKILYCEGDVTVLAEQSKFFEHAGYAVERVQGRAACMQALQKSRYDVVVLGHTLTKDDRHHLPYMAKKSHRETQVMVLHASGKHHAVDFSMDSREGEQAIIKAIHSLVERKSFAAAV